MDLLTRNFMDVVTLRICCNQLCSSFDKYVSGFDKSYVEKNYKHIIDEFVNKNKDCFKELLRCDELSFAFVMHASIKLGSIHEVSQ